MSSTTTPAGTDTGADTRWRALLVLCAGMLMMVLDATVVNVALPAIQSDLGFSQSGLAWVVNGYLVAFGGLLLIAGRLGDLLGSRRVFLAGLVVFTVSSIACGLAQDQTALVAARFVQGVGGAMTTAVTLGMIVTMFPEPREQAKAMGVFGFVASSGGSVGLLAGGVLTQLLSWHWIFIVNAPIGVVVYALTRRWVPATEGIGWRRGADVARRGARHLGLDARVSGRSCRRPPSSVGVRPGPRCSGLPPSRCSSPSWCARPPRPSH